MRLNKIALGLTVFTLTALMVPLAFAAVMLNIDSSPVSGVAFTLDGDPQVTPFSAMLGEGTTHEVVMPSTVIVDGTTYNFVRWEDGSTNPTRTIYLFHDDKTICAYYEAAPLPPHGRSPGYWKHQFLAYIDGKGEPQETWADLVGWTAKINAYYSKTPPEFYGYALPPVSSLDVIYPTSFTTDDAYSIFKNKAWKDLWIGLANWYNWAAGLGPYPNS